MSASLFDPSEAKDNGTRLARLLIDGGTHVLRQLLLSMIPLATLPTVLNKFKPTLQNLKSGRRLFDDQWELLYPSSGQAPDANKFDITLLHLLLREICALTEPSNGWHNMPAEDDDSQEAHIVRIKCFRNDLCHNISTGVPNDDFEVKWRTISRSLEALGVDPQEVKRLKNETIDHDTKRRIEKVMKYDWEPRVSSLEHDIKELKGRFSSPANNQAAFDSDELSSCLPDEVPEAIGRAEEIQVATQAILGGKVSVVEITGAPGFGKTTVANKVAHELAKPENNTTVFYCSLTTKSTLNDVTTSMFLACSASQSQPPDNPHNWLLNWSKQRSRYATFILDNADSAIECNPDFVDMMQEMRTLSRQKVSFVVTSRKTIPMRQSHLDKKEVRVNCLSKEEAERLLLSKVSDEKRKTLTQTEKLVELCARVPLALCIVGCLLSDYNEARLIASLEKEPLEVMENDEMSLKNAIQTSFNLLKPEEQKALAIFSVFPGSFDSDAAEAVLAAGTNVNSEAQIIRILRSLKNQSLLEHTSSGRYQIHQFIQTFCNMICKKTYPDIFNDLEKAACNYFVRLLSKNAARHYTKDKCMASIEAFSKDRHNFEYFLQVFVHVLSERPGFIDAVLESSSNMFFDRLPEKCRYLERCLLPSFYIKTLEKLLCHFDTGAEPVHKVEILCLLSTEKRRVGKREEYFALFDQAKRDYSQRYTEFRTNGLSQVLFFNSYARFLFEWRRGKENRDTVFNIALYLCHKKIPEDFERAATVLSIGQAKKNILILQEATAFFSDRLGEHFLTAQGHKAIADVYFSSIKRETDLNKAIFYYENALAIMKKCGMGENKESILALKNYALCQRLKGNPEEAIGILEKAKQIAEVELEDDHRWKVMIDTQRALLYEYCERSVEEAKEIMKNALEMWQRLGQSINRLGNKREILRFVRRFPTVNPR